MLSSAKLTRHLPDSLNSKHPDELEILWQEYIAGLKQ
jgi:hypothetical protein